MSVGFLRGRTVDQVGIVVRDLRVALARYEQAWPGGRWGCRRLGPDDVPDMTFRGAPAGYSLWMALNDAVPQLELIEPLEGPSHYHEWLEARGEGLHHLGIRVESVEEAVAGMTADGFEVIQTGAGYGLDGDGGYAYFDTVEALGYVLEAIELPRRGREPDFVWPPPS